MIARLLNKLTASRQPNKAIVLMYHRIASLETDPWQLAVNPDNFEQQLRMLKRKHNVISVNQLSEQLKENKIEPDSICITFDDGYCDNYFYAKPLLEKHRCPATFFIPSGYIDHQQFWWDELESIIVHSQKLPAFISLSIQNEPFEFKLNDEVLTGGQRNELRSWVWNGKAPNDRCELYLELWKRLRRLPLDELSGTLKQIREWAGCGDSPNKDNGPMNSRQLKEMFDQPLFTMGVHTVTHPALAEHSGEVQSREISLCRQYLEKLSGKEIISMAYPYGNYNDTTLSILKEQNIAAGFTTNAWCITPSSDPFQLGRFQVTNQSGKDFEKQLRIWMKQP